VTFESGSRLSGVSASVFSKPSLLSSIVIRRKVLLRPPTRIRFEVFVYWRVAICGMLVLVIPRGCFRYDRDFRILFRSLSAAFKSDIRI
jgi:hypothetical protein